MRSFLRRSKGKEVDRVFEREVEAKFPKYYKRKRLEEIAKANNKGECEVTVQSDDDEDDDESLEVNKIRRFISIPGKLCVLLAKTWWCTLPLPTSRFHPPPCS